MPTVEFTVRKTPRSLMVLLNTVKVISISTGGKIRRYSTDLTTDAVTLARLVQHSAGPISLNAIVGPGIVSCFHDGEPVVTFFSEAHRWSIRFPTGRVIRLLRGESRLVEEALRPLLFPDTFTIAEPDSELPDTVREKYDAVFEAAKILGGVATYADPEKADAVIGDAIALALHVLRTAKLIV